jgi:hypothetical protein
MRLLGRFAVCRGDEELPAREFGGDQSGPRRQERDVHGSGGGAQYPANADDVATF